MLKYLNYSTIEDIIFYFFKYFLRGIVLEKIKKLLQVNFKIPLERILILVTVIINSILIIMSE